MKKIFFYALLFLIPFIIRFIYLNEIKNNPFFNAPVIDSHQNDEIAFKISTKTLPKNEIFYQAPFYPYFLSLIYKIFGHNYFIARFVQIIFSSFNCILVYLIALKLFNKKIAVISWIISSFYAMFIFYDCELERSFLVIFLNLLVLLFTLIAVEKNNIFYYALSGFFAGISAITRENTLFFIPFLFLWIWQNLRDKISSGNIYRIFIVFTISCLLPIIPITIRNYIAEKDFILISKQAGINFYIGNTEEENELTTLQPGAKWDKFYYMPYRITGKKLKSSEWSGYFFSKALEFIKKNPLKWLKIMIKKFFLFWNAYEFEPNTDIDFYRTNSFILKTLSGHFLGVYYPFGVIVPFSILGLLLTLKENKKIKILHLFILSYMLTVIFFHVRARYRLPVVPLLLIFSAWTIYNIWILFKEKMSKPALKILQFYAVLLFFINFDFYSITNKKHFPLDYYLGYAYQKNNQIDKAEISYKKAIQDNPYFAEAYIDLGMIYLNKGMKKEGFDCIINAVNLAPEYPDSHYSLGIALKQNGLHKEALKELEEAIKLKPNYPEAYYTIGNIYNDLKEYDRAIDYYSQAIKMNPYFIEAHHNLGVVYQKKGLYKKAIKEYLIVLKINPDFESSKINLTNILKTFKY